MKLTGYDVATVSVMFGAMLVLLSGFIHRQDDKPWTWIILVFGLLLVTIGVLILLNCPNAYLTL